jgi:hypothetical protein
MFVSSVDRCYKASFDRCYEASVDRCYKASVDKCYKVSVDRCYKASVDRCYKESVDRCYKESDAIRQAFSTTVKNIHVQYRHVCALGYNDFDPFLQNGASQTGDCCKMGF